MSESGPPGGVTSERSTIREVARRAGVAIKTVSRVMNGEPYVSEATTSRVMEAVRALDYRPHPGASDLRRATRKHRTIGLMIGAFGNPFSTELQRAVEQVATEQGAMVLTASLDRDAERERQTITAMLARRTEALLITTPTRSHDYLREEQEHGMAVVFVDGAAIGVSADAVLSDNRRGAATAARHLLERGHRRIAFLGARSDVHSPQQRRLGFLEELARHGIHQPAKHLIEDLDEESAIRAVADLFASADPPTAIFSAQNLVTVGAIKGLRRAGQLARTALVGFDDVPLFDLLEPAVTVVRQNPREIGLVAARRAFERLNGDSTPPRTVLLPVQLIQRGSGEIGPPDD
jgi:LacI family transcriptional regulator